ncbi:hypothetical protein GWC95_09745 [Sediminibacterium roseum]|uniref:Uncharacterized protein n=1 Tax=Sediminibacterium roseum TaxID=1978412 RepID=A0ABW9ZSW6_9BACT|nr:hypothetical protein [Sediminibacterium roseum]NCI50206.1 hypothetical protein [Sediminibacterium roseum]
MKFRLHRLLDTHKFSYVALSEETGHSIYFNETWLHLLPPQSLRLPDRHHLPAERSIELDLQLFEKMLGDFMGQSAYSLAVHFGFKTIVIRYYDARGKLQRVVDLVPGEDRVMTRVFEFIYPMMEAIHYTVFHSA